MFPFFKNHQNRHFQIVKEFQKFQDTVRKAHKNLNTEEFKKGIFYRMVGHSLIIIGHVDITDYIIFNNFPFSGMYTPIAALRNYF